MTGQHIGASERTQSELRVDPLSGRIVAVAPARGKRPGAKRVELEEESAEERDRCPFCEGREDRTPPEVYAAAARTREPDTPGWQVRVVPNLYPAFDRQEVVVHTPRHVRSLTEMDDEELEPVGTAWHARIEAARREGFPYVHVLVNEGRDAGASLPHSHSQLIWLREAPPEPAGEYPNLEEGNCALCRLLDERPDLALGERAGVVLLAHPAGRAPYELLVAPLNHQPDGEAASYTAALRLLRDGIRRVRGVEGAVPVNAWLHPGAHWHLEVVPRIGILAGVELGAGLYVNWLPAEDAAEALRAV